MKRRLNILCLMVIFVLSYSVLEGICGGKGRYPCVAAEADAYEVYKLGIT